METEISVELALQSSQSSIQPWTYLIEQSVFYADDMIEILQIIQQCLTILWLSQSGGLFTFRLLGLGRWAFVYYLEARQGFGQGAAKNGELCGTMKLNCAAKKTNCVTNCAVVNS